MQQILVRLRSLTAKIFRTSYLISHISYLFIISCQPVVKTLPILGERKVINQDTVYHTIPDFKFMNQDSVLISNQTFEGKIYVADFFFTSCPTICPIMKTQMLRVYKKFEGNQQVSFLSHSLDPRHDSISVLKTFAKQLGVSSKQWHFIRAEKDKIYEIGQKGYFVTATDDELSPGGIMHSGAFVLVDKKRRIRGVYDGTQPNEVDKLMSDMDVLSKEKP